MIRPEAPIATEGTSPRTANRLRSCLHLALLAAGLWAVAVAAGLAWRHPESLERRFGVPVAVLLAVLGIGGLALLVSSRPAVRALRAGESSSWTPLRVLFELVVVASVVYLAVLPSFAETVLGFAAGLVAALWGFFQVLWNALRHSPAARRLRFVDLLLFNLCLFAVLAEGGLRVASRFVASPFLVQAGDRTATVLWRARGQQTPGRLRYGFPVNSRLYYDTELEPPGDGRRAVAVIGDSFSYGVVPHHYHFSTVCERNLKTAEVYNFGLPAIGPFEYLYLLRHEVLATEPDLVVVNVFVGNDVSDASNSGRQRRWVEGIWDRGNLLLYLIPQRLARLREEGRSRGEAATLEKQSLERRVDDPRELAETYPWLKDPSLEKATILKKRFLRVELRRAVKVCDPQTSDYSALFEALSEMRRLSGDRPFLVQLIPDEFQLDKNIWRFVTQRNKDRGLVRDLPQQRIGEWLEEQDIPYLDLLPEMRRRCAGHHRGDRHCYHLQDTHWNVRGNRVAGSAMAAFLAPYLERIAE